MISAEQTYNYSVGISGLNLTENENILPASNLVNETYNINLYNNYIQSRGGTKNVLTINDNEISSFFYFDIEGTNGFIITTFSGKIYNNETELKSGLALERYSNIVQWNNDILISNKINIPQVWNYNTNTISDLSKPAIGWDINKYPSQMVVHGKGNAERLWVIGAGRSSKLIYFSAPNNGIDEPDFSNPNPMEPKSGFIFIETGDYEGLTGIVEFGDRLIAFSNTNAFIILDDDLDPKNWGYTQAQWYGGCASWRLIARLENDLLCMNKDGTIYSISAVQEYGDYQSASITSLSYIDNFLNENFNLEEIEKFHCLYDPSLRAVKIFGPSHNSNKINQALVYFIDKTPSTGWSFHNNDLNVSGYNCVCSNLANNEKNQLKIFTGDYNGNIWELETEKILDNSLEFYIQFVPPPIEMDVPSYFKRFKRGYIEIKSLGIIRIEINIFVDGLFKKTVVIRNKEIGYKYGTAVYGEARYATYSIYMVRYPINLIGKRITQKFKYIVDKAGAIYGNDAYGTAVYGYYLNNYQFFIGRNIIDYMLIGYRI